MNKFLAFLKWLFTFQWLKSPPLVVNEAGGTVMGKKRAAVVKKAGALWPDWRFGVTKNGQGLFVATRNKKAAPYFPDKDSGPVPVDKEHVLLPGGLILQSVGEQSGTINILALVVKLWGAGPSVAKAALKKGHAVATLVDKDKKKVIQQLWTKYWAGQAQTSETDAATASPASVKGGGGIGGDFDLDEQTGNIPFDDGESPGTGELDEADLAAMADLADSEPSGKPEAAKPVTSQPPVTRKPAQAPATGGSSGTQKPRKVDREPIMKQETGYAAGDVTEGLALAKLIASLRYDGKQPVLVYIAGLSAAVAKLEPDIRSSRSKKALQLAAVAFAIEAKLTERDNRDSVAEFAALDKLIAALELDKLSGPFSAAIKILLMNALYLRLHSATFGPLQFCDVLTTIKVGGDPLNAVALITLLRLYLGLKGLAATRPPEATAKKWTAQLLEVRTAARVALAEVGLNLSENVTSMLTRAVVAIDACQRQAIVVAEPSSSEEPLPLVDAAADDGVAVTDAEAIDTELSAAGVSPVGVGSADDTAASAATLAVQGADGTVDPAGDVIREQLPDAAPASTRNGEADALPTLEQMEALKKPLPGADVAVDLTRMVREGSRRPGTNEIVIESGNGQAPSIMIPAAIVARILAAGGHDAKEIMDVDEMLTLAE